MPSSKLQKPKQLDTKTKKEIAMGKKEIAIGKKDKVEPKKIKKEKENGTTEKKPKKKQKKRKSSRPTVKDDVLSVKKVNVDPVSGTPLLLNTTNFIQAVRDQFPGRIVKSGFYRLICFFVNRVNNDNLEEIKKHCQDNYEKKKELYNAANGTDDDKDDEIAGSHLQSLDKCQFNNMVEGFAAMNNVVIQNTHLSLNMSGATIHERFKDEIAKTKETCPTIEDDINKAVNALIRHNINTEKKMAAAVAVKLEHIKAEPLTNGGQKRGRKRKNEETKEKKIKDDPIDSDDENKADDEKKQKSKKKPEVKKTPTRGRPTKKAKVVD